MPSEQRLCEAINIKNNSFRAKCELLSGSYESVYISESYIRIVDINKWDVQCII